MLRLNSTTAITTRKRSYHDDANNALLKQEEALHAVAVFGGEVDNVVVNLDGGDNSKLVKRRQAYRSLPTKVVVTCKIDGRFVALTPGGVTGLVGLVTWTWTILGVSSIEPGFDAQ
jgi:hypothetical protein